MRLTQEIRDGVPVEALEFAPGPWAALVFVADDNSAPHFVLPRTLADLHRLLLDLSPQWRAFIFAVLEEQRFDDEKLAELRESVTDALERS